jgi:hypothetical protein
MFFSPPTRRGGEGNTHVLGFFDRMVGLSISSRQSKEGASGQPPAAAQGAAQGHAWQQPLPRQPGGASVSGGSLEALAAKGWAGMPQSEDNNDAPSTSTVAGGGAGAAPAPAVGGRGASSSHGRRSGSGSLGSLAAMMPWIRRQHNGQASSSQPSRGSASMQSASGMASTDSALLRGSLAEAPRFVHPLYHLVESNRLEPKVPGTPVTARDLNTVGALSCPALPGACAAPCLCVMTVLHRGAPSRRAGRKLVAGWLAH